MSVQGVDWTNQIIDITEMQICITNNVVEVNPSEKNVQGKHLQRRMSVDTGSGIVNAPSECLPTYLVTSMQQNNTTKSTYMDNNNLYLFLYQPLIEIVVIHIS